MSDTAAVAAIGGGGGATTTASTSAALGGASGSSSAGGITMGATRSIAALFELADRRSSGGGSGSGSGSGGFSGAVQQQVASKLSTIKKSHDQRSSSPQQQPKQQRQECFPGLTLLSQVCVDEGVPGVVAIKPQAILYPSKRVGMRPPCNDERQQIIERNVLLEHPLKKAIGHSCASVYRYYCSTYHVKPNSYLCSRLAFGSFMEDDFTTMAKFDASGGTYNTNNTCSSGQDISNVQQSTSTQGGDTTTGNGASASGSSATQEISSKQQQQQHRLTNLIGDRGLLPVLEVLRLCPNLTAICLPGCDIRNAGVECLVHMLLVDDDNADISNKKGGANAMVCPQLDTIDLRYNNLITIGAGKILLDLVKQRPRLRHVKLEGTRVDQHIVALITDATRGTASGLVKKSAKK